MVTWQVEDAIREPIEKYYAIKQQLGSGKFSIVKEGVRFKDGERVAIKIIQKGKYRYEDWGNEVKILRKLRHPHITNIQEVYESPTHIYIVLDLVTGGELFDKIVDLEHYSEENARKLTFNLISVLEYIHSSGIIHRDLKPENLLLASPDRPITDIKVADFGLAIIQDGYPIDDVMGTPGYMAPEVVRAKPYNEKVDMWSVGVILYILLCGYPPYEDDDMTFSYKFHLPEWDSISQEAKNLIQKLLQKDPEKRLSAKEALKDPWLITERSHTTHMVHTVTQLRKFNARRRLKKGFLAVASVTRMQRLLGAPKTAQNLAAETAEAAEGKSLGDQADNVIVSELKTVNSVLRENFEVLQNISQKASQLFKDISSSDKQEEAAEHVEELLDNIHKIEEQIKAFKRAYLKEFMKGKDLSHHFV